MIKNIIFDLGRVIIDQPEDIGIQMVKSMFPENFENAYKLWREYSTDIGFGKKTSLDFLNEYQNKYHTENSLEDSYKKWKHAYGSHVKINHEMIDLIDSLNKKHNVYILSDTIDAHFEFADELNIFSHVKKVFASHKEGVGKKDGKAFENILQKLNTKPSECVFIDDLKENVDFAEKYGIHGILFTNVNDLKKSMRSLKLL